MRYAILSDIHSNLEALTAVLRLVDNQRVEKIVCLGDLVGYYANPNECLQIIRERNIPCIIGNHDRVATGSKEPTRFGEAARIAIFWTRDHLTIENLRFLEKLPLIGVFDEKFLIVHGSLYPEPNEDLYLTSKAEVVKNFETLEKDGSKVKLCFFGHTHHPLVYEYQDGRLNRIDKAEVNLNPDSYYLINPGSVGQSRDRDPRAAFLIFDSEEGTVCFHRVDYDRGACYRKAGEAGLLYKESLLRKSANWLGDWIEVGREAIERRWLKQ